MGEGEKRGAGGVRAKQQTGRDLKKARQTHSRQGVAANDR